jgi:hypothetical protein
MGKRILKVAPEYFVMFLQRQDGRVRNYSVESPLPDDTKYIGFEWADAQGEISLIVESEAWWGDSRVPLQPPSITVHYGEASSD